MPAPLLFWTFVVLASGISAAVLLYRVVSRNNKTPPSTSPANSAFENLHIKALKMAKHQFTGNASNQDYHDENFESVNTGFSNFKAISIAIDESACHSAKAYKNVKFLLNDVPLLPLMGCTKNRECYCYYNLHQDRRIGDRRKTNSLISVNKDKRKRGRRASDARV